MPRIIAKCGGIF